MSSIGKGDFALVPREYAETVIPGYSGAPIKRGDIRTYAKESGTGKEDNTLLYVCDRTDNTITLAVPMFETLKYDSFLILNKGTTDPDAFEKSGHIRVTDSMPLDELRRLYIDPAVMGMKLARQLAYITLAVGFVTFVVTKFVLKMDAQNVAMVSFSFMIGIFCLLGALQGELFNRHLDREFDRVTSPFYELQKRYNFFQYKKLIPREKDHGYQHESDDPEEGFTRCMLEWKSSAEKKKEAQTNG